MANSYRPKNLGLNRLISLIPMSKEFRPVWLLAYPIIVTNMSETLLGVVDTYMVGQLGIIEIGAVGLGASFAWLFYLPLGGLAIGINHFGSSAPAGDLAHAFGFTADQVCDKIEKYLRELL